MGCDKIREDIFACSQDLIGQFYLAHRTKNTGKIMKNLKTEMQYAQKNYYYYTGIRKSIQPVKIE